MSEHRLLVIDDLPQYGRLIADVGEMVGFSVMVTQKADDFLDGIDTFQPSAVTVDLLMPETDGIELLRELALRGSSFKILLSSGADSRMLRAAAELGTELGLQIRGVIGKPLRVTELRDELEKLRD